ncbi:TPA: hypothetical protein ACKP7Q_000391 [Stenotrophomonas maltophilia]
MQFMLDQIRLSAKAGAVFPAVVMALTIPDIAGAVDSGTTVRSNKRYREWLDAAFYTRNPRYLDHGVDGHCLYAVRCKLLHEAASDPSTSEAANYSAATRQKKLVGFYCVAQGTFHLITAHMGAESRTILDGRTFCEEMVTAADEWLAGKLNDPSALRLIQAMVDVRMEVPGLSRGLPVVC